MEDIPTPHLTGTHAAVATCESLPRTNVNSRELIRNNVSTMSPAAHRMRRVRARGRQRKKQGRVSDTTSPSAKGGVVPGGARHGPMVTTAASRSSTSMDHLMGFKQILQTQAPQEPAHHFWFGSSRERRVLDRRAKVRSQRREEEEEEEDDEEEAMIKALQMHRRAYEDRRIRDVQHSGPVRQHPPAPHKSVSTSTPARRNVDSAVLNTTRKRHVSSSSLSTAMIAAFALIVVFLIVVNRR